MNAKAPQKPPEGAEKPSSTADLTLPHEKAADDVVRTGATVVNEQPKPLSVVSHPFTVRVPLVCPHCSSYMMVLSSGIVMTCQTERCPNHLKKFRLPVLYAEEVKD